MRFLKKCLWTEVVPQVAYIGILFSIRKERNSDATWTDLKGIN
jgi:hypothetical protein